jgi:hypothetical protein
MYYQLVSFHAISIYMATILGLQDLLHFFVIIIIFIQFTPRAAQLNYDTILLRVQLISTTYLVINNQEMWYMIAPSTSRAGQLQSVVQFCMLCAFLTPIVQKVLFVLRMARLHLMGDLKFVSMEFGEHFLHHQLIQLIQSMDIVRQN